jgi:hypothetical protein
MQLEIDLSNKAALLRQERELQLALDTVRFALKNFKSSENGESGDSVFEKLPDEFTRHDVIGMGFSRDQFRAMIEKWKHAGRAALKEKGVGTNPAVYKKL